MRAILPVWSREMSPDGYRRASATPSSSRGAGSRTWRPPSPSTSAPSPGASAACCRSKDGARRGRQWRYAPPAPDPVLLDTAGIVGANWARSAKKSGARMATLTYQAPTTVQDAVRILAGAGGVAKVLAGGTDLLVQLRSGRVKPDLIVDTKKIPGLIGIREVDGGFVIGAATPGAVIGECKPLEQAWPGVVEAANLIGSTQVQGRASLAGNLCNASPAADSVPALIAAKATVVIVGPKGRREAPVESICTGPGKTSLARDEIVVAF